MRSEEEHFIIVQNIFLKYLNLPYDKSIVYDIEEDYEDIPATPEEIKFDKMWDDYFEQKSILAEKKLNYLRKNIQNYMMNIKNSIIVVYKTIM